MYAIDKIKAHMCKETITKLMDKLNIEYRDDGNGLRAACPIHGGDNPTAFNWSYDNGLWYCFTGDCGGGSILEFVREYCDLPNTPFPEIVEKTAELLEIDITGLSLEEAENSWVKDTKKWISYMNNKHKKSNIRWDYSSLGELYSINSYRNFDKELLSSFGVYYSPIYDRVVALIHDDNGQCVGATMRATKKGTQRKWLHAPKGLATGDLLYNIHRVESTTVYIVEGVWDVLNMHKIGYPNVVATFGAHLSKGQIALILKHFTDVILMYDNDKAGRIATTKAIEDLKDLTNLYVLPLGDFTDPGEVTKEYMENVLPISSCKYKLDSV